MGYTICYSRDAWTAQATFSKDELGTMSKNKLREITLGVRPIWGIHSLTLILSCLKQNKEKQYMTYSKNVKTFRTKKMEGHNLIAHLKVIP